MKKLLLLCSLLLHIQITISQVGIGTTSPTSTLHVEGSMSHNVTTLTTSTTLDQTHNVVLANNTSNITLTLPASASNTDKAYYIKKINSSTATVTIDGNAAETIDGATTLVLYVQYDAVRIVSDGSNWYIIDDEIIPHRVFMYHNGTTTVSNDVSTTLALNAEEFDVGPIGDATTDNRVEILRDGEYSIDARAFFDSMDDQEIMQLTVHLNGTTGIGYEISNLSNSITDQYLTANVSLTYSLSAGDYITIIVRHDEGGTLNTYSSASFRCYLCVTEIR